MKSINLPTNRLRFKFSKTAFLDILKYVMKRACLFFCHGYTARAQPTTFNISSMFVWQDKNKSVKISFQASWFTNRTWLHYDEANDIAFCHICMVAYVGTLNSKSLEKAFIVKGFSNWKDASDSSKCHRDSVDVVIKLPKAQAKMASECFRIASTDIFGEVPRTPPYERGVYPPVVLSPSHAFGERLWRSMAVRTTF